MAGGAGFDGVGADVGEDAPRTMSSKKSMRLFVVSSIMASLLFEDAFFLCAFGETGRKRSTDLTRKNTSGSAVCQMSVMEASIATKASAVDAKVKRELARIQIV